MHRHPDFEQPADCDPNPGPVVIDDHPCLDNLAECPNCGAIVDSLEQDGGCVECPPFPVSRTIKTEQCWQCHKQKPVSCNVLCEQCRRTNRERK